MNVPKYQDRQFRIISKTITRRPERPSADRRVASVGKWGVINKRGTTAGAAPARRIEVCNYDPF